MVARSWPVGSRVQVPPPDRDAVKSGLAQRQRAGILNLMPSHKDPAERNRYSREYMARRYAARRAEAISCLGGQCAWCGATEGLELDHIDRSTKIASVAKLMVAARAKFEAEVAKCQLLCQSCHGGKTHEEVSVPHGGGIRGRIGCRCDLCRAARTAYFRELRGSKPRPPRTCGTRNTYRQGCRCEACTKAHRDYNREWLRGRRLKVTGP